MAFLSKKKTFIDEFRLHFWSLKKRITIAFFKLQGKHLVHFIHIGKTGGSALRNALKDNSREILTSHCFVSKKWIILFHGHEVRMEDIPKGEKIIFCLRDPAKRFVSGFYQDKKTEFSVGRAAWGSRFKSIFNEFETANDLAMGISSPDTGVQERAAENINYLGHLGSYCFWLKSEKYIKERASDILFIGFQESLSEDFEALKIILSLPEEAELPKGKDRANKMPSGYDPNLEEEAIRNLQSWYREDYKILAACKEIAASIKAQNLSPAAIAKQKAMSP